jgi:hypothetical protein
MAFKLKDLIISLLPQAGAERACPTASAIDPRFCPTASADFCPTASAARVQVVFCPTASAPVLVMPATPFQFCPTASAAFCPTASAALQFCPTASAAEAAEACPTASAPTESAAGREGLAALKQQLQQALAQVEEQEKAMAEPQLPQTVAETEELEAKLREALEELRQHKENLKKG